MVDDFRSGHFKNLEGFKGDVIAADVADFDVKHYFGGHKVDLVFHLASITDTTDHNQFRQVHDNVESWRNLLNYFEGRKTRLVYASSRRHLRHRRRRQQGRPGTEAGQRLRLLQGAARQPRPPLRRAKIPTQIVVGLRYFNVYGPREAHKGAASSMILQLAQQMRRGEAPAHLQARRANPRFRLREGHRQLHHPRRARARVSGIYNAGSGVPRSLQRHRREPQPRPQHASGSPSTSTIPTPITSPTPRPTSARRRSALRYTPKFTLETGIDDYAASGFLI